MTEQEYMSQAMIDEIMSKVDEQQYIEQNNEDGEIVWKAQEGSQKMFLSCPAYECLNSGTRGSGKSDSLIMDYLKDVGIGWGPSWRGILFRETYKQLDDIVNRCMKWIPRIFPGATFNKNDLSWTFQDGEKLLLRYMGNPRDYWNYHGHEFCVGEHSNVLMGDDSYKEAKDVEIGDLVQTLQGPKKITKIFSSKKPGVIVSVLNEDSSLIGTQHLGLIHPVLTSDGWQRIGLSCLSQISEQSQLGELYLKEVFQFLHGVHQETLLVLQQNFSSLDFHSTSLNISKWYSCLTQIFHQFLHLLFPELSSQEFHLCVHQENFSVSDLEQYLGIFCREYSGEHQQSLRLLQYCVFLINHVSEIHLNHVHLLESILSCSSCLKQSSSRSSQSFQGVLRYPSETLSCLERKELSDLLTKDHTVLNDIISCVQTLMNTERDCQDHYSPCHDQDDGFVPSFSRNAQSLSPLQNDALGYLPLHSQRDVQGTLLVYNPCCGASVSYMNPYTRESFETKSLSTSVPFSISSCETPVNMIDFEVEDANHYITKLDHWNYHGTGVCKSQDLFLNKSEVNTPNNQDVVNSKIKGDEKSKQIHIVMLNCWIGWEELSNWVTGDCYEEMKSCCRSSELKEINGKKIPRRIRATTNPFGAGHGWMKSYFVDKGRELEMIEIGGRTRTWVSGHMLENLVLMEADPDYIKGIAAISDPNKRKAWLEGSWDIVAGGAISDLWSKQHHVLKPFEIPQEWKVNRSFDWGASKPFSVGWWAMSDGSEVEIEPGVFKYFPVGSLIRIDEWYGWDGTRDSGLRMPPTEVAKKIKQKETTSRELKYLKVKPGPADSSIFNNDVGSINIAKKMMRWRENGQYVRGIKWTRSNKRPGTRIVGLELFRDMLAESLKENPEQPCFYVFDTCRDGFLRTVPTIPRSKDNPDDADTSSEDHCLHGNTKVWTDKGHFKIKDLVGTTGKVKTTNGEWTNYFDCRKTRKNAETIKVFFDDDQIVICTPDHKFLNNKMQFVEAKNLIGEKIYNVSKINVSCVKIEKYEKSDVYCLVAEKTHCFAINNGIIVHNCFDEVRYRVLDRLLTTTVTEV